jgi:hypothetical protein
MPGMLVALGLWRCLLLVVVVKSAYEKLRHFYASSFLSDGGVCVYVPLENDQGARLQPLQPPLRWALSMPVCID